MASCTSLFAAISARPPYFSFQTPRRTTPLPVFPRLRLHHRSSALRAFFLRHFVTTPPHASTCWMAKCQYKAGWQSAIINQAYDKSATSMACARRIIQILPLSVPSQSQGMLFLKIASIDFWLTILWTAHRTCCALC